MATKRSSSRTSTGTMKVTTVRFGEDLWALLSEEAARAGVSVSQYVREAALARAAFAVGARAEVPAELFGAWARTALEAEADPLETRRALDHLVAALGRARQADEAAALQEESRERGEETAALIAQSQQTARRARETRRAAGRRER
jgi:hypothetical protein